MILSFDYEDKINMLKKQLKQGDLRATDSVSLITTDLNGHEYIEGWDKDPKGNILAGELLIRLEKENKVL